jgi:hypothetical protein
MSQEAHNRSDAAEYVLVGKRYLIHDRDPLFTAEFPEILAASGVQSVKLPPRSPNLVAHAERFVFGEVLYGTPSMNLLNTAIASGITKGWATG